MDSECGQWWCAGFPVPARPSPFPPLCRTPLMLAIMNGHVDCVHLLLEKGSTADAADLRGRTALHRGVSELLGGAANSGPGRGGTGPTSSRTSGCLTVAQGCVPRVFLLGFTVFASGKHLTPQLIFLMTLPCNHIRPPGHHPDAAPGHLSLWTVVPLPHPSPPSPGLKPPPGPTGSESWVWLLLVDRPGPWSREREPLLTLAPHPHVTRRQ